MSSKAHLEIGDNVLLLLGTAMFLSFGVAISIIAVIALVVI